MKLNVCKYKEFREKAGMTDKDICSLTGLPEDRLQWIFENKFIAEDTLELIADAIGVAPAAIAKGDYDDYKGDGKSVENAIEFIRNAETATVTFSQGRFVAKIKKLAESHPDECNIIADNKDGSLCAHIPVKWIKIAPVAKRTDKQRELARQRMLKIRQSVT